jgi:hypothetical protein
MHLSRQKQYRFLVLTHGGRILRVRVISAKGVN